MRPLSNDEKRAQFRVLEEIRKVTSTPRFRFLKHEEQRWLIKEAIEKHASMENDD